MIRDTFLSMLDLGECRHQRFDLGKLERAHRADEIEAEIEAACARRKASKPKHIAAGKQGWNTRRNSHA